ncbi:hypothetical protein L3X38_042363 [Prunus dulcis]|uniref:Uncharacterized protein n=1 Tax=Prunus dulcis TaxID=3755 RepID=A0AAD4UW58_PRUDU|nr:hypothetical protein L3X38_042363 [Prunus dulcis]
MGDSVLVLKQLFGNYKVTSQALLGYHALASHLMEDFDDVRLGVNDFHKVFKARQGGDCGCWLTLKMQKERKKWTVKEL